MARLIRTHVAVRFVALACCLIAWSLTRLPGAGATDADLAARFAFQRLPVNEAGTGSAVRPVAPAFHKIRSWISSVGAGVGMFDADGNDRADDLCLVDPRTDRVTIRPAPGTAPRYGAFALAAPDLVGEPWMAPMGCLPADFDEDGRQDVLVYYWGRSPVVFLRTPDPIGPAAYLARDLVRPYQVWNSNAATLADVDADGHLDVVIGNYFPDGARVLDPTARQDELRMQRSMSLAANGGTDRILLFRSASRGKLRDVTFAEARGALPTDLARGWTLAVGAQDLNDDGRPELYLARDFGPDRLLLNRSAPGRVRLEPLRGPRDALTPKSKKLGNDSFKGMGVAFTHLDDDPVPDIVVSNITEPYALQESNFAWRSIGRAAEFGRGYAPYRDDSEPLGLSRSGWGWDVKAADFDADGTDEIVQATGFVAGHTNRWPQLQELAMTNDELLQFAPLWPQVAPGDDISGHDSNPFFTKGPSGRYADIGPELGVGGDWVSRSLAVGDVDGDGRLDLAVANQWDRSYLFLNRSPAAPYLGLRLRVPTGPRACSDVAGAALVTRPAVGAAVTVTPSTGPPKRAQLYPAGGHGGVSAPELYFGLAKTDLTHALRVDIRWRDHCDAMERTATVSLRPGWHTLVLTPLGIAQEK